MSFLQESVKQVLIALGAIAASLWGWSALGHYAARKVAEKCKNSKPIEFEVKPLEFKTFDSKSLIGNPGFASPSGIGFGGASRDDWQNKAWKPGR
jgi:hypothetical protein